MKKIYTCILCIFCTANIHSLYAQVVDNSFKSILSASGYVAKMALQNGDRVLVAGKITIPSLNKGNRIELVRLKMDGSVDSTFTIGSVLNGYIYAVKVLKDGKIIVGGSFTSYNGVSCNNIIKLLPNGIIDSSFKPGNGLNGDRNYIKDMYELDNGKIVIGGNINLYNGVNSNLLVRLNSDGSLDQSFIPSSEYTGRVETIAVQKDGKLLIAGGVQKSNSTQSLMVLLRLNVDGTLDNLFQISKSSMPSINKIELQNDGKILVGGDFDSYDTKNYSSFVRLNQNGSIDETFKVGSGFKATHGGFITYPLNIVSDIELQNDGKLIVSGNFYEYNGTYLNGIVRLNTDGTIEQAFNACQLDYKLSGGTIYNLLQMSDGVFMACGDFRNFLKVTTTNNLMRLNANPDPVPPVNADFDFIVQGNEVVLQNNSKGALRYEWDFGDYSSSKLSNPSHKFRGAGNYNITLTAYGNCGSVNIKKIQANITSIKNIYPDKGGNSGLVTVKIDGIGFSKNSIISLDGAGLKIKAESIIANNNGREIVAIFDLTDKKLGTYDITVQTAGNTYSLKSSFKIMPPTIPVTYANVVGRDVIRAGRTEKYIINFGNKGNVDIFAVPLNIEIPKTAKWSITPIIDTSKNQKDTIPFTIPTKNNNRVIPLLISKLPANTNFSLELNVNVPAVSNEISISAWTSPSLIQNSTYPSLSECYEKKTNLAYEIAIDQLKKVSEVIGFKQCQAELSKTIVATINEFNKEGGAFDIGHPKFYQSYTLHLEASAISLLNCAEELFPTPSKFAKYRKYVKAMMEFYNFEHDEILCAEAEERERNTGRKKITVSSSYDPNHKSGQNNVDNANSIQSLNNNNYLIQFENLNKATAPAQEVIVIDTLDKNVYDLSLFKLSGFGFGKEASINIPQGLNAYSTNVDLRPSKNLIVRVDAKLDTVKGIVKWRFLSLDPATLELTDDPLDGFLPPNKTSPEGEGYVSFSIMPKAGLATGTQIKNKSVIYFDTNEPIVTNTFLNTIDDTSPISKVAALNPATSDTTFAVKWGGADEGAGIRSYDVYYNVNKGTYELWQYDVSATEANFTGKKDSIYSFYSIAKDFAGNIEASKNQAETETKITSLSTINFASLTEKTFGDADFDAGAVSTLNLPLVYFSSNPNIAVIKDNKIHIVGVGKTNITAKYATDNSFKADSITSGLIVNKAAQSITFNTLLPKKLIDADFQPGAVSSSGLAVTYTSSNAEVATIIDDKIHLTGAGKTTIMALQNGNANYLKASEAVRELSVSFALPVTNFKLFSTGESCRTSNDGQINITAQKSFAYTVSLSGLVNKTFEFSNALDIKNLEAGNYTVCITIAQQPDYKQCFDLSISEPKDLAVQSVVDKGSNSVLLSLQGGANYHIVLNGFEYETTKSQISLPLTNGNNTLSVTADKSCQGKIEKTIAFYSRDFAYPNPFETVLNLSVGKSNSKTARITISNISGQVVYTNKVDSRQGVIQLNLSHLQSGLYMLRLLTDNSESFFKIMKR